MAKQKEIWIEKSDFIHRKFPSFQRAPYFKPLPYLHHKATYGASPNGRDQKTGSNRLVHCSNFAQSVNERRDYVTNKALSKLYDELGQAEDLVVAFKERQKSIDMAVSAVRTLVRIARAVKRRDPKIVRQVLQRNPSAKDIIKTPAGLWMSYHFGWAPTVSDLHHALTVFSDPIPALTVTASSKQAVQANNARAYDLRFREGVYVQGTKVVKLGCEVLPSQPNVNLASRLGFGQPLSVAWELTPFSWFVDYFVNVGEFIKNFEPRFPGLTIVNPYWSSKSDFNCQYGYADGIGYPVVGRHFHSVQTFRRRLEHPSFVLSFNPPSNLSGQRLSYIVGVFLPMMLDFKRK